MTRQFLRSGQFYEGRQCPVHHGALELCLDESDHSTWQEQHQVLFGHHDNRVGWRCEACVAVWLENHFLPPDSTLHEQPRFLLRCPSCGSPRVDHKCVPECCNRHRCLDCHSHLEATVELVLAGTRARTRTRGRFGLLSYSRVRDDEVLTRTGLVRSWRQCHKHPEEGLELAMLQRAGRHSVVCGSEALRSDDNVVNAASCTGCGADVRVVLTRVAE